MADQSAPIEDGAFQKNNAKLSLAVEDPLSLNQIGFWPDSASKVHKAINKRFKLTETLAPGWFATQGDSVCIRTAFDAYLLLNGQSDGLHGDFSREDCALTDLSHSRAGIAMEGPAVEPFLNRDVAIDLSLDACPIGKAIQTSMHHMPVLLLRHSEERFVLYVYRSYARDLADWLADMAVPFQAG